MDGRLVSDLSSDDDEGGSDSRPTSYGEVFEKLFPLYLVYGMTPEQYWDGDPTLARAYRAAEKLKASRRNEQAWLQGLYIYEALCCVAPVMRAFAKKGTRVSPYPDAPHPLTAEEKEDAKADQDKRIMEKGKAFMAAYMEQFNKRFHDEHKTDTEEVTEHGERND